MSVGFDEVQDALGAATIACADRAKQEAGESGSHVKAEIWASAAAQLAFAYQGTAISLPARPGG